MELSTDTCRQLLKALGREGTPLNCKRLVDGLEALDASAREELVEALAVRKPEERHVRLALRIGMPLSETSVT